MTWAHFVPDYDKWLDGTYAKQWGEANDVEVKIDHINNALLYTRAAAEVAAQSGHDLFWFISPPCHVRGAGDPGHRPRPGGVEEGRPDVARSRRKATYNPKTKQFFGFSDSYAPDPVQYRRQPPAARPASACRPGTTCARGRAEAEGDRPPGRRLGMSNEIDSNMLLTRSSMCFGGFIQNEENRIVIGQGRTVAARSRRSR